MTTNSSHEHDPIEEALVAQWLAPLDAGLPPYDAERAEQIALAAADVFLASEPPKPTVSQPASRPPVIPRSKNMLAKIFVALSALVGTITWFVGHGPARAGVTVGAVLDKTAAAKSLQFKITKEGQSANVWVKLPGEVRWEESPTEYRIAIGSRLWQIDEKANTYETGTSAWYDEEIGQVDLLGLIGVVGEEAARFRESTPSAEEIHDGKACQIFRMTATVKRQPVVIEAIAESATGTLQSLAVWPKAQRAGAPLAELALVARDVNVEESQFAVAKSLSEDGRIGKLTDSQGIVGLKPVLGTRWTPVCRQMLLKPGDWLRTDVRGANAVTAALTSQYQLIVGPGTLAELENPHRIRLHGGEINISGTKAAEKPLELVGPKDKTVTIAAGNTAHYRINRDGEFQEIKQKPKWLAGYDGSSTSESLGSLIANVNNQDVPLTLGYHKVKVEIRDQIARTTIEESFVNHTRSNLEGVFHFPLPQDASISGFGMWINNELVEADVVEKQRAREIYETILREKRDPGLLEWSGGNIFKARVFPIFAESEKRIRIEYTQVLPLRANRYRYSYGLRSEMLRKTPLRELSLDVQIQSALPIKSVDCPTHSVRTQLAEHSAKLEFSAQEYTPERDFEIVCEVDSRNTDVVVIPHQRGEDGYFLVQLTPPGGEGNWQREILPDGNPLELLVVCDTSASMDSEKRKQQEEFVAALMTALGPKDKFNLAVCDVDCQWMHKETTTLDPAGIDKARKWLEDRISLGWTDLDVMTESVLKQLGQDTHVIYVGDGIVTAHNADPQEFVNRLKRLTDNKRAGTFHAIAVGNSFESTVLKALAQIGGGSVRQVGGEQTPQKIAFELMNEIAQPGLKDLKVEFRGLQVAAIYPDKLPNLAAATQQILIGRYLPEGKDQSGEIIITGKRDGETVRFASRISLANAEEGNSFIPRLWARAHLDHLLSQGASSFIQDQIIALSEEFHIITPYTSLLVLESDEDRERFGVKRRFEMRDGERFFAEGRDQSHMELLQQQMKLAGDWRLGLRRNILARFARLGRSANLFEQMKQRMNRWGFPGLATNQPMSSSGPIGEMARESEYFFTGGGMGGGISDGFVDNKSIEVFARLSDGRDSDRDERLKDNLSAKWDLAPENEEIDEGDLEFALDKAKKREVYDAEGLDDFSKTRLTAAGDYILAADETPALFRGLDGSSMIERGGLISSGRKPYSYGGGAYVSWIQQLFPAVPLAPAKAETYPTKWQGEALEISKSLIQPIQLDTGGLELVQQSESRDPRWDRVTNVSRFVELYSPKQWLHFTDAVPSQTLVGWCTEKERGMASRAFQLGQVRASVARDLQSYLPGQRSYATTPLHETYREYNVEVTKPGADRVVLTMTYRNQTDSQIVVTIDTAKKVILEFEYRHLGKRNSTTKYSDHIQVAGVWWPGKIEGFDAKSRLTSTTTQTVKQHDEADFTRRMNEERPDKTKYRLLAQPLPSVREAEKAVANGSADFEDHLVLLVRFSLLQKWNEVFEHLKAMEAFQPEQPGLPWIRAAVSISARKYEEARKLLQSQIEQLAKAPAQEAFFLAGYALDQVGSVADANETLRLLDLAKPILDKLPMHAATYHGDPYRRTNLLRSVGRVEEVLALQKELAQSAPWDANAQVTYARDLVNAGDYEAAYAWLRQEINRKAERELWETQQIRDTYAEFLRTQGRDADYVAFMEEWIAANPEQYQPYQQYLSALMLADRMDEANATAKKWMEEGRIEGKLEPPALFRLSAAVSYALGERYQVYSDWIDPIWLKPLKETAIHFLNHEHHFEISSRIVDAYRFRETDECREIKTHVAKQLLANAGTISVKVISQHVSWALSEEVLSETEWKTIAETLRKRWDAEEDADNRQTLGNALVQIYARHFRDTEELPFRREQIARAEKEKEPYQPATLRRELFDVLLARDWSDEHEAEAFALIEKLTFNEYVGGADVSVSNRMLVQLDALHKFVDRMIEARNQAAIKALQDQGHPENLTRTDLAKKKAEFLAAAQEGVAKRLADRLNLKDDAKRSPDETAVMAELLQWIRLERMHLDLKLNRNHAGVAKECWDMLGDAPKKPETDDEPLDEEKAEAARRQLIESLRLNRAFVMANYLAVRRSADPMLVERLKNYIALGLKWEGDLAMPWKAAQFALLAALDQPEELERLLSEWIRTDPFPAPWQLALGRLSAERGKIEEAIRLYEAVQKETPLSPADFSALGDWYLVIDRKEQYKRAKIEVFKAMPEYQISNWIRQVREPWQRTDTPLPAEFDERVLFAFQALFEKSNEPQNYLYELREFYTATRDFRLLAMLPDSLVGRTPQQIYPFLNQLQSSVLYEMRNESAADEILKRLAAVRAKSESAIDFRALDLLEAIVERQSAAVLNQPGPHIDKAIAALKRAFEREWAEGEVRQMAEFLDSLGTITQPGLNDERLRQLRALHPLTKPGTDDRLFVAWHLAHALFWSHNQKEEGLAVMQVALREYQATHAEGWPAHANTPLDGYVDLLEAVRRFGEAEEILNAQLVRPANPTQKVWLLNRQNQSYHEALREEGQVSLGQGETLYQNLYARFKKQLSEVDDENHRYQSVYLLLEVFRTAQQKKYAYQKDLKAFAFDVLPEILKTQMNNYSSLVTQTAYSLRSLVGPKESLEFLIIRYENYPKRFEYTWQSAWQQLAYSMAEAHRELEFKAGELEPRLLAIVLKELRRELETTQSRSGYFYHDDYSYFWAAKAEDFARVAEEVYIERSGSGRSVAYIARYLYHGLNRHNRAIEMLLAANDRKLLDRDQQITLVDYLHEQKRHGESIPILQPLVEKYPDEMAYRTRLITAYRRASRLEQMRTLLTNTDVHFRKEGRWTESNISQLALVCLENQLYAEAVKYYGEVIPLHERTAPNQGIGQGALSEYYSNQARAYSGLGNTQEAVEAASAGVVAWGPRHDQRQGALNSLEFVLSEAKDLDEYVKTLDKQAAESEKDSPTIRQAIGKVYARRNEHQKAIAQFRLALELQPANVEAHQQLIASYDALNDSEGAIQQTLALLDVDRHNLELYKKLAERLAKDDALSERAATTIVEAAPNEAEHHHALAEVREKQNRWQDAIVHWKEVAKLRALEPEGLLQLAKAQIHEKQFGPAQDTVNKLNRTEWPARFNDLPRRIQELQNQIPKTR